MSNDFSELIPKWGIYKPYTEVKGFVVTGTYFYTTDELRKRRLRRLPYFQFREQRLSL